MYQTGESQYLCLFHTPEEAALCVVHWVRDNGEMTPKTPMIAAKAVAAAAAEGTEAAGQAALLAPLATSVATFLRLTGKKRARACPPVRRASTLKSDSGDKA